MLHGHHISLLLLINTLDSRGVNATCIFRRGFCTLVLFIPTALKPFRQRQGELTTEGSCLLWGGCVVIPQVLRPRVMEELHCGHPGVVRMKQMARSHAWWPGMDHDIETAVRACEACQRNSKAPPTAPGRGPKNHGSVFILTIWGQWKER